MTLFPTFARFAQSLRTRAFWRRLLRAGALALFFLALLGFCSNLLSSSPCVADTRRAVIAEFGQGTAIARLTWLSPSSLQNAAPAFRASSERLPLASLARQFFHDRLYLPHPPVHGVWAFTRVHLFDCPFLVRVYYGHDGHSGCTKSAIREYLALFGYRILLSDDFLFIT